MDGLGRGIKTETGNGTTTVSTVDTQYVPCGCSPLGKVGQVSQPYAPGGTVYWTVYHYDGLGRTTSTVAPDGSTTNYGYSGNQVTVTDPAGKSKNFFMDAVGNLIQVQENDPSLGLVSTTYTYDMLNHLTTVTMPRGSNTQTRTFNYITGTTVGIDLLSATNPENGTVTYTYNSDHTLHTKTDAKGQVFTYAYDSYKRLTSISVGGAMLRTFIYDTNTLDSSYSGSYTQGRLVAVQNASFTPSGYVPGIGGNGNSVPSPVQFTEMYAYTQPGLTSGKRLQVQEHFDYYVNGQHQVSNQTMNLDGAYTFDNEGKMTSVNYPTTKYYNQGQWNTTTGPTYTYSFDAMSRPTGLTDQNNTTDVSNVSYNAANQLLAITYFGKNETRTYNTLNQMTNVTVGSTMNITYTFPAGTNNGKISSQTDSISGETVTYQYDSLNRLLSASSNKGWSETYGFDGFGNLLSKTPTGGAPTLSQAVNAATNRIVGQNYDANGNQTSSSTGTLTYDAENRVLTAASNGIQYAYDSRNKRVWSATMSGANMTQVLTYFGVDGQKLGTYTVSLGPGPAPQLGATVGTLAVFFGGKRVGQTSDGGAIAAFTQDRLGSNGSYYPYGEAHGTVPQDQVGFATYTNDSATGLQYADQRYYASNWGRFMSPDPYTASGGTTNPKSWNRYTYVEGDPINFGDPEGRVTLPVPMLLGPGFDGRGNGGGSSTGSCGAILIYGPTEDNPNVLPGIDCLFQNFGMTYAGGGGGGGSATNLADAQSRLKKIASGFNPTGKCRDFLNDLLAKHNSADMNVDTLISQIQNMAAQAANNVYDGPSSTTPLTDAAFPGANSNGAATVGQWFAQQGSNAIALSQFNGAAIFLNSSMSFGDQYGLGLLLHELLHKEGVDGGFSHAYMEDALNAAGAPSAILGQADDIGSRIGEICFH